MKPEALDKLIESVEAGDQYIERDIQDAFGGYRESYNSSRINRAYRGSLDAALALHEALLPGPVWITLTGGFATICHDGDEYTGGETAPARAWLLAILRAYRSQVAA